MSEDFRPYETPATWNGHEGKLNWTSKDMWVFEWDTKNGSQNVSVIDDYGEMPQTTCTERLKENCIGVQTIFGETARRLWRDVINRRKEEVRRGENNSRPRIEHWLHQSPPQSNSMDREDDDHEKRDGGSRRHKSKQRKSRKSNQSKKRKSRKNNRRRR